MQWLCLGLLTFGSRVSGMFLQVELVANNRIAELYAVAAFAFAFMGLVSSIILLKNRRKLLSNRKRTQWFLVREFHIKLIPAPWLFISANHRSVSTPVRLRRSGSGHTLPFRPAVAYGAFHSLQSQGPFKESSQHAYRF